MEERNNESNLNKEGKKHEPYIGPEKSPPEFTFLSVLIGILIAIVFGAANAYLGLKVGMTISASIPAAVISMALVRIIFKRKSILENNMVQTIASAGESLAAGAIFTLPALFLWGQNPDILTMTLVTFVGGALGVLFMVPLRKYLIVKEHGKLPYPEGVACAGVLVTGEKGGLGAKKLFLGGIISFIYKFFGDGLKLFHTEAEFTIKKYSIIGGDFYPALLGVGFIIGPKISSYTLGGGVLAWLVFIPLISFLGQNVSVPIFPSVSPIKDLDAWGIWGNYIRYIGAGAVLTGGIISLIKSFPVIIQSLKESAKNLNFKSNPLEKRTEKDLDLKFIISGIIFLIILIAILPQIPVGILGAILIALFGFLFVTVSSRIVGLVGSSSNPVSGMTIATLLITTVILKRAGYSGTSGMVAALIIGAVVCTSAAIAGDTSQDLKTGFLVGATPWKQQVGELLGVIASAMTIGFVLIMLNSAYKFGSKELSAPQATLMKLVIEGIISGNLPWNLVFMGIFTSIMLELLGIPSLPVAIGLYLPIHLSTPIMAGGIVRWIIERKTQDPNSLKEKIENGILFSSGLIAGEGLMGVLLAFLAYLNANISLKEVPIGQLGSFLIFIGVTLTFIFTLKSKK